MVVTFDLDVRPPGPPNAVVASGPVGRRTLHGGPFANPPREARPCPKDSYRTGRIASAMPLTVKVEVDETGTYVAEVEDLPGCVTQASSFEELLKNLREAITGNIEARRSLGYAVPRDRRMRLLVETAV